MPNHQIIYTSCMRGINGINDGQQIYSYDESFSKCKSDEVKSLFSYQVPSLPVGTLMDDEIALTMPSSFSYRLLDSGLCSVSLNTYLGRDYMGGAGRFGNHLSHSILSTKVDFNIYPCELYCSRILRSYMDFSEVNNSNPPEYLPTLELEKGYKIDVDNVVEFLGINNNFEHYKSMLCALLKFSSERKRIVICDEPDNIIMWIAALEYTLPLDIAKTINFTTYEFDPDLSPAQICGVIPEGTRYNSDKYVSNKHHFLFDFIENKVEQLQLESDFYEFVDTAMSFSYESLVEFHEFIINKFSYRTADEKIYGAYTLYQIETEGLSGISQTNFENALQFASEYGSDETKTELVIKLLEDMDTINGLDDEFSLIVISYLLDSVKILDIESKEAVNQLILNRILISFSDASVDQNEFISLYNNINDMAKRINLSLENELMKPNNRHLILKMFKKEVDYWKIYKIIKLISDYAKETKLPVEELYPDRPIGSMYSEILNAVYTLGRENGIKLVYYILEQFKNDILYLVNMTLNIEGFLKDMLLEGIDNKQLWDYFNSILLSKSQDEINEVHEILNEYERYEEMYSFFDYRMVKENNMERAREVFKNILDVWFEKNKNFREKYLNKVIKVYADKLIKNSNSLDKFFLINYAKELLEIVIDSRSIEDYVDTIEEIILDSIPLEKPDKDNARLINEILNYQYSFRHKEIEGKLLLICIGMLFGKIRSKNDIPEILHQIKLFSVQEGADLRKISDKVICNYWEWILLNFRDYNLRKEEISSIYDLFQMSKVSSNEFMLYWSREYFKKSKELKDYRPFCEFLSFMFKYGDPDDRKNTGKLLCKLNKQKMEEVDLEFKTYFEENRNIIKYWKEIKEVAESTNPILNNISNRFKRRKD